MKNSLSLKENKELNSGQRALAFFAVYCFLFALVRLFIKPIYEMADDFIFSEYINCGCYNLIFTNYYLAKIIGTIQNFIYPHNAYVVFYMANVIFAFIALAALFGKKFKLIKATVFVAYLICFTVGSFLLVVSFTRIPVLLCTTGILYLLYYYDCEKWLGGYFCGLYLTLIGSMYRFVSFEAVATVGAVFAVSLALVRLTDSVRNKKSTFKDFLKDNVKPAKLAFVAAVAILTIVVQVASVSANNSTPDLKYYNEYTSLRSALLDYDIPTYEEKKEEYDKIGIDADDYAMLRTPHLDDKGAFTIEKLQQIKQIKDNSNKDKTGFGYYLNSMFENAVENVKTFNSKFVLITAFFIVLIGFAAVESKRKAPVALALIAVVLGLVFYLHTKDRVPFRAEYPIWGSATVFLLFSVEPHSDKEWLKKLKNSQKIKPIFLLPLLVVFLMSGFLSSILTNEVFKLTDGVLYKEKLALSEYVEANPDIDFELTGIASLFDGNLETDNNFYIRKPDEKLNYKTFSGTYYRLYVEDELVKKILNTDNMYTNLVNDNVYYVTYNDSSVVASADNMAHYLKKYYFPDKNVKYRVVKVIEAYTVYDFYLE